MPQFDFTTLFSVTFSFFIFWVTYYSFFSISLFSEVLVISKFRSKVNHQGSKIILKDLYAPILFLYKGLVKP